MADLIVGDLYAITDFLIYKCVSTGASDSVLVDPTNGNSMIVPKLQTSALIGPLSNDGTNAKFANGAIVKDFYSERMFVVINRFTEGGGTDILYLYYLGDPQRRLTYPTINVVPVQDGASVQEG